MSWLRRKIVMFTVSLFILSGVGVVRALEIENAEGRPWDSGSIGVDDNDRTNKVFHIEPRAYSGKPSDEIFENKDARNLDEWFAAILSFLNP